MDSVIAGLSLDSGGLLSQFKIPTLFCVTCVLSPSPRRVKRICMTSQLAGLLNAASSSLHGGEDGVFADDVGLHVVEELLHASAVPVEEFGDDVDSTAGAERILRRLKE